MKIITAPNHSALYPGLVTANIMDVRMKLGMSRISLNYRTVLGAVLPMLVIDLFNEKGKLYTLRYNLPPDIQPRPMKALFQRNGAWADIMETYPVRPVEIEVVTKMLACGTPLTGSREWRCSNPECTHHRYIHQSCHRSVAFFPQVGNACALLGILTSESDSCVTVAASAAAASVASG